MGAEDFIKPVAGVLIKSIVNAFITPFIKEFRKKYEIAKDKAKFHVEDEMFYDSLLYEYQHYQVLNSIVLKKGQHELDDLYIPLTITSRDETEIIKIDRYPTELINKYKKVLIVDHAGMGKSTIMKKMYLDVIERELGYPIFINLRSLNQNRSILEEVQFKLSRMDQMIHIDVIKELITEGQFIFFLDGYDEIQQDHRYSIRHDIASFISKGTNNLFFMASRPEDSITSFGNFRVFTINSLEPDEAFLLLRKYDNNGYLSERLIDSLSESVNKAILDFLKNPLLTSLLYTAYYYKEILPLKKHEFYRQVFDAYYVDHDITKEGEINRNKISNLSRDDFHRILRYMGFCSLVDDLRIEYSKDDILKLIAESKAENSNLSFSESQMLDNLSVAVPVFRKDGNRYYWSHKSLMEYFAAHYIYQDADDNKPEYLKTLYNHKDIHKFRNVLDIYYDIDIKSFDKNITLPFCREFLKHYMENGFPSQTEGINKAQINRRKAATFMLNECLILIDRKHLESDSEIISRAESKLYNNGGDFYKILSYHTKELIIITLTAMNTKSTIYDILVDKKHPIVGFNKEFSVNSSSSDIITLFENENEIIEIDNSLNNIFNLPENFEMTTNILYEIRYTKYPIDINKVHEEVDRINGTLDRKEKNNFLERLSKGHRN